MSERYLEDPMLVERAQKGDRAAFDALVGKYEVRAYQFAYRLSRNHDVASDIVVEAFLRVYNAIHRFKGKSSFPTWLYRILTNCYLDHRKREKSRPTLSLDSAVQGEDGDVGRELPHAGPSPHQQSERSQREGRFEQALSQLADFQRAMIIMYHAEMMSYEEIAAALDLPVGTVKSRLNRARLALREILSKDEELFSL